LFVLEDIMIFGIMGLLLSWYKSCGKYLQVVEVLMLEIIS